MFKVECPGCKAPYQVDERRIPPSGLKMRCPKCGSSFKVDPPGDPYRTGPSPVLGAVFGAGADSLPPPALDASPPAVPRTAALKATMLGVGAVAPAPAAAPPAPRPGPPPPVPPRAKPAAAAVPSPDDLDLPAPAAPAGTGGIDLPVAAAPRKGPPPAPPRAKPAAAQAPAPAPAPPPPRREASSGAAKGGTGIELDLPDPSADLPAAAQRSGGDLPVVRGPGVRASSPALDVDLPSISSAAPVPSPSPPAAAVRSARPRSPSFGEIELDLPAASDLPAARGGRGSSGGHAIDLPGLRGVEPSVRPGGAGSANDLPSPQAANLPSPQTANLPSPQKARASSGSFDLPAFGGVDLPLVGGGAGLPLAGGGAGLPSSGGGAGLPSAGPSAGLPNIGGGAGLPLNASPRFPAGGGSSPPLELESPAVSQPSSAGFGALDLEPIGGGPSQPSRAPAAPKFDDGLEADPFGEAPLPPPRSFAPSAPSVPPVAPGFIPTPASAGNPVIRQAEAAVVRQSGGGTAYGEVNLSFDAGSDVPLDASPLPPARAAMPSEEDMEFGEVPQEREPAAPMGAQARPELAEPLASPSSVERRPRVPRAKAKLPVRTLVGACVLLVGGASLGFMPQAGPFGAYWVIDHLRAQEYQVLIAETAKHARGRLGADTAPDAVAAAAEVDRARAEVKRVRGLSAYAAFVASMRELRFGPEPEVHARSKVLLDELAGEGEVPYLELARAARAATEGQLARARQAVSAALRRVPSDVDALALSGEVELRARNDAAAVSAWQALAKLDKSARAAFGLARARFSAGDRVGAEREAKAALERNPRHVGAKILLARIAAVTPGQEAEAISLLEQVAKQPELASSEERVGASTLLGDIHINRSRISRAEAAYTDALKINPKAARALIGLGEALYRAGRYSEAQARFEAGAQADPDDVFAKVGVAKSKLMLERLEDAQASLKKLRESHPASLLVSYWYGRVLEAVGDRAQAERVYAEGIAKIKDDPLLVDAYIALALLQNQQGRAEEAQKTLATARARLPASAAIHRALGDVALSQGRYSDAQTELRQAVSLDPEDLAAKFRLGSALRRDRKFDDALHAFDEVAATDAEYPGLALERGLLFEASNRTTEALKAYESALAKAPDDPDLMLRVGCGYATAVRTKEAEELLRKVLALRPTSAETNHCLGRALLAEGSRLADALRMLERAVELDPHRAEFHLYVGWAANEAGNVPKAQRELDQAIALDQSLADAYWQRGVLRQRQGAVRDAVQDLTRALQLRPTRYEAHAALADAYYDLGREALALGEWQKAVAAQPDNATWHFRYGKLLVDNRQSEAARTELGLALTLAEKKPRGERWIWEAHHRMARAIGARADAVPHWEAFLRLGPLDSPYRAEAKTALEQLGHPWIGN